MRSFHSQINSEKSQLAEIVLRSCIVESGVFVARLGFPETKKNMIVLMVVMVKMGHSSCQFLEDVYQKFGNYWNSLQVFFIFIFPTVKNFQIPDLSGVLVQ
jgi:hypothetical protein